MPLKGPCWEGMPDGSVCVAPGGLCEREGELASVDALLSAARAGRGGVLLITGPAGIGKTVLLGAARQRAGQAGMRVLAGRGGDLEGDFSFGVARQLFEPLLAGAGAAEREALLAGAARRALIALEGQAGAGPPEAGSEPPFAVMHGLYWLTVNASGAGPVALRVARLGPAAGELARAAAVLGDGAQLRHAAALAGVGLAAAAAAADGLAGIGVFKPGTPLGFVHPIVRTAVHEDIALAGRGLRHAEAARLLAAEGADLDAVCAHLLVCEPAGSAEVVERLRAAAARAVGRGAPESAVAYLRRAMSETTDVSLRAVLAQELGRAEKVLGDPAAAEHLYESLQLTTDPAARAAVAPDLAELLLLTGQWEAGTAVVREALAEVTDPDVASGGPSPAAVARLQAWWAGLSAYDPSLVDELDYPSGRAALGGARTRCGVAHAGRIARGSPGLAG